MLMPLKEFKALHRVVDQIFEEAYRMDLSWSELAERAGLSLSTVYNLGNYDTLYPRAATVFQLAQAVGFKVEVVKGRSRLKVVA